MSRQPLDAADELKANVLAVVILKLCSEEGFTARILARALRLIAEQADQLTAAQPGTTKH